MVTEDKGLVGRGELGVSGSICELEIKLVHGIPGLSVLSVTDLGQNWVRLAPIGINLGLLKIAEPTCIEKSS